MQTWQVSAEKLTYEYIHIHNVTAYIYCTVPTTSNCPYEVSFVTSSLISQMMPKHQIVAETLVKSTVYYILLFPQGISKFIFWQK